MKSIAIGMVVLLLLSGGVARADDQAAQARALNDKAMAEFALGDYAPAAEHYEAAFRLKPDGALLYNAAQAHRLAGNRKRSLDLYRSFVRVYGAKHELAPDAKRHIIELEHALAAEPTSATPPRPAAAPPPAAVSTPVPPPPPSLPPPSSPLTTSTAVSSPPLPSASPSSSSPPLPARLALDAPAPPPPNATLQAGQTEPSLVGRSLFSSPWFWGATGAVVVVAVVLLLALRPSYPDASLGKASGN